MKLYGVIHIFPLYLKAELDFRKYLPLVSEVTAPRDHTSSISVRNPPPLTAEGPPPVYNLPSMPWQKWDSRSQFLSLTRRSDIWALNKPIFGDQTTKLQPAPPIQGPEIISVSLFSPFYMEEDIKKKKKVGKQVGPTAEPQPPGGRREAAARGGRQRRSAAKRCPYYKISHAQHPSPPLKSRSLRPPPRDPITDNCSTLPDRCQSPATRGDASSECKAPVTPPTYHMDASLFKFASLTPFRLSIPLLSSSLLQNTVYFGRGALGLRSRDLFWTHQVMNLRDSKLGNPNQVITNWGRMETSTKSSLRGSWFSLSRQCC